MRRKLLMALALPAALKLLQTAERFLRARGRSTQATRIKRMHTGLARYRRRS